ncbi:hypothetical protein GCM10027176_33160 [Actinoallomurus bryophytorum]
MPEAPHHTGGGAVAAADVDDDLLSVGLREDGLEHPQLPVGTVRAGADRDVWILIEVPEPATPASNAGRHPDRSLPRPIVDRRGETGRTPVRGRSISISDRFATFCGGY